MSILAEILERKRSELAAARARRPLAELEARLDGLEPTRDFASALRRGADEPLRVLAEYKRASPSAGTIRSDLSVEDVAAAYERGGAAAMSVLTDKPYFKGDLGFLARARRITSLPLLRKDFLVERYQLVESRVAGADAVLLIASALDDDTLRALHAGARELGLAALVEVHSEAEAERAVAAGASIIGVNHRDLHTFEIDLSLTGRLATSLPADAIVVAESGIRSPQDCRRLAADGAHAVLVGEHLMRAPDPGEAVQTLVGET